MAQCKFWFSEKHSIWLHHCDEVEGGRPRDLTVLIDGKRVRYTAAHGDMTVTEPFDGALKNFPDYQYLGEGDFNTISSSRINR